MGKRLYVGNLPYGITDAEIRAWFAPVAVHAVDLIIDRDTGRQRGFGFVEVDDTVDLESVIASHDRRELGGRMITVNAARDKQRPAGGGRDRGRGRRNDRHRDQWD